MNPAARENLLASSLDPAYHLALRLTGNESDAWDLTQDAMRKALLALPRFRGESAPRTWVYRIVINLWKDRGASAAARFRSRTLPLEEAALSGSERRPEDLLETEEASRAVEAAVDGLPAAEREVLTMREFAGLRYEAIARALGVPIGTVKSRLARARIAVKRSIEAAMIALLIFAAAGLILSRPHLARTLRRVVSQLNALQILPPR